MSDYQTTDLNLKMTALESYHSHCAIGCGRGKPLIPILKPAEQTLTKIRKGILDKDYNRTHIECMREYKRKLESMPKKGNYRLDVQVDCVWDYPVPHHYEPDDNSNIPK